MRTSILHLPAAVLVGIFVSAVALPRLGTRAAPADPPGIDHRHRAALALVASDAPDAAVALVAVRDALADPEARALYERGMALLSAGRAEDADVAFTVALRLEREREMEW
jgi:Flp pilus assembly protein TadD